MVHVYFIATGWLMLVNGKAMFTHVPHMATKFETESLALNMVESCDLVSMDYELVRMEFI